jgi:type I restriction enzyme, R subunit
MTGFDVPACSTIYLDKPMRNHTLMQTIARANRVFGDKVNGLIVDYIGVFRNLQRTLAIYATGNLAGDGAMPVKDKDALIARVRAAVEEATVFCAAQGIDLTTLAAARGFARVGLMDDAEDALVRSEDIKLRFLSLATMVDRLFRAMLPDEAADTFGPVRAALVALAARIGKLDPDVDISDIAEQVGELIDTAIVTGRFVIPEPLPRTLGEERAEYRASHLVDLSQIDFEALRAQFAEGRKHTEAEKLRGALNSKLRTMVRLNKTRMNYLETFQQLIADYNAGASNVDAFFTQLLSFARSLSAEEQRTVAEQLSEEELALFDLLTKPEPQLSRAEQEQVKRVARELLQVLKQEKLVLDWRKRQQTRASVEVTIEKKLDELPEAYSVEVYEQKCRAVYQHVYDSYYDQGRSLYSPAA